MKLFYVPGACSLANHIALIEAGIPFSLSAVSRDKTTDDGRDFRTINPKGYVPALEFDDGTVLTENLAVLVYIAEKSGRLLASEGIDRSRALEALAFMSSEVHGNFKPLFYPDATEAEKSKAKVLLTKHFVLLDRQLGDKKFLIGSGMTIADTYLFVMLTWAVRNDIAIGDRLPAYLERMRSEPSVLKALKAEGLTG